MAVSLMTKFNLRGGEGEARWFIKIELGFRKLELLFKWVHYNFRRNCLSYFSAVDFGR